MPRATRESFRRFSRCLTKPFAFTPYRSPMDRYPIDSSSDEGSPASSVWPAEERPHAADSTELGSPPVSSSTPFPPTDPAASRPAGPISPDSPAASAVGSAPESPVDPASTPASSVAPVPPPPPPPSGDAPSGYGRPLRPLPGPRRLGRVVPLVRPTTSPPPPVGWPDPLRRHPPPRSRSQRLSVPAADGGGWRPAASPAWR